MQNRRADEKRHHGLPRDDEWSHKNRNRQTLRKTIARQCVANSPLCRGQAPIHGCQKIIGLLGLHAILNLSAASMPGTLGIRREGLQHSMVLVGTGCRKGHMKGHMGIL